eukprot:3696537-Rhodomonas_salina.2
MCGVGLCVVCVLSGSAGAEVCKVLCARYECRGTERRICICAWFGSASTDLPIVLCAQYGSAGTDLAYAATVATVFSRLAYPVPSSLSLDDAQPAAAAPDG